MSKKASSFISRNMVTIVMVPSIIGIHYFWSKLQDNRSLVAEHEAKEAPFFTIPKVAWNRLMGDAATKASEAPADVKIATNK